MTSCMLWSFLFVCYMPQAAGSVDAHFAEALLADDADALHLLQINVRSKVILFNVSGAEGNATWDNTSAEPLNGAWYQAGFKNGKPAFANGAGAAIKWEALRSDDGGWAFHHLGDPNIPKWTARVNGNYRYIAEEATDLPPTAGWVARNDTASGSIKLFYTNTEGTINVEDAGTPEVNGVYHRAGFHFGMPRYAQLDGDHHITYVRGWWLLAARGQNLYVHHSHSQELPNLVWSLSMTGMGKAPAPKITVHDEAMERRAKMFTQMNHFRHRQQAHWMTAHRNWWQRHQKGPWAHGRFAGNGSFAQHLTQHGDNSGSKHDPVHQDPLMHRWPTHRGHDGPSHYERSNHAKHEPEGLVQKGEAFVEHEVKEGEELVNHMMDWLEHPSEHHLAAKKNRHSRTPAGHKAKHDMSI